MGHINFASRELKLKAAMDWLQAALADGQPHYAGGLMLQAAEQGIAERTLQRASTLLRVQKTAVYSKKVSAGMKPGVEGWLWSLPAAVDASGAASGAYKPRKAKARE